MSEHTRFALKTTDDLKRELARLGLQLPMEPDLSLLGEKPSIGGRTFANRFVVHPMEGFDANSQGEPTELTKRRYCRYAAGGSSLIWYEATAVVPTGRSNSMQLWLREETVESFQRLNEAVRNAAKQELTLVLQMTHSGRYSRPQGDLEPVIGFHSPELDRAFQVPADHPIISDEELDRLQEEFVEAARLAARAGFDGVDMKCCHRYLISELLSAYTREGRYGGSYENRTRFVRETITKIRQKVPRIFVTTRMNAFDAIQDPVGWGVASGAPLRPDLTEPIQLAKDLADQGVELLSVTVGNPRYNPFFNRPYNRPVVGAAKPPEHPLAGVVRFQEITREIQQAVPQVAVVAGALGWLQHLMPEVAAGMVRDGWCTLIGQGRGAFAYPESVHDLLTTGKMRPNRCCLTCSMCSQLMRDGMHSGCVIRDKEIYAEQYRLGREKTTA